MHTQGKMNDQWANIYDTELAINGVTIAKVFGGQIKPSYQEGKANAKRLAACWNALASISTETLEMIVAGKLSIEIYSELEPNAETIAAMQDARAGRTTTVSSLDELRSNN